MSEYYIFPIRDCKNIKFKFDKNIVTVSIGNTKTIIKIENFKDQLDQFNNYLKKYK